MTALVAALYTAVTVGLTPLSYGPVQVRFAEALNLLAFVNPVFAPGVILGCLIANLFSPIPLDWLFGTVATALSAFFIILTRSNRKKHENLLVPLLLASIWPVVFNGIIIGFMLAVFLYDIPFFSAPGLLIGIWVAVGQILAISVFGVALILVISRIKPLYKYLQEM